MWRWVFLSVFAAASVGCGFERNAAGSARSASAATPSRASTPCELALAPIVTGTGSDEAIAQLQTRARLGPRRDLALEALGVALIAKARMTDDAGGFELAIQAARCLAEHDPAGHQSALIQGHALHQTHQFSEAAALARQLVAARGSAPDFGLLGDVLIDTGQVEEAGAAYQRMLDLKPYFQSYARASHFRWLKGDLDGALRLMRLAESAASPRDPESLAWARTRLALYHLQEGRVANAASSAEAALRVRSDFPAALVALARIRLAQGRETEAIEALQRTKTPISPAEHGWLLADALRAHGRINHALVVESRLKEGAGRDGRTLALYLATRGDAPDMAVALARKDLERRQDVFTHDTAAWALLRAGQPQEARTHMVRALAAGTKDARLYLHAGAIALAHGERPEARRWLQRANQQPHTLFPSEREQLRSLLARL